MITVWLTARKPLKISIGHLETPQIFQQVPAQGYHHGPLGAMSVAGLVDQLDQLQLVWLQVVVEHC